MSPKKYDGFGQDGEGHRQVQPHPVSYKIAAAAD